MFIKSTAPNIVKLGEMCLGLSKNFQEIVNMLEKFCHCCKRSDPSCLDSLLKLCVEFIRKDPYKYCDLFIIIEAVISLFVDQSNIEMLKNNITFFCDLCSQCLNGKWQDSDFLSYCLKLLATIYSSSKTELLAQPAFAHISEKLLTIFLEYNSYEARRDILKFW